MGSSRKTKLVLLLSLVLDSKIAHRDFFVSKIDFSVAQVFLFFFGNYCRDRAMIIKLKRDATEDLNKSKWCLHFQKRNALVPHNQASNLKFLGICKT